MTTIIVYEKVKDHDKWLEGFNADAHNRKGSKGGRIMQVENDPNSHYIIFEWSDKEAHEFVEFVKTPTMQKVLKDAGVLEHSFTLCSTSINFDM